MSDPPFDPYHRWLGIPPKHQPADHYRLLGLERFEDDPEVILDGAELRIAHVRKYCLGEHAQLANQVLSELAKAKACLLDPQKKAAYDAQLQRNPLDQLSQVTPPPTQTDENETLDVFPEFTDQEHDSSIRRKLAKAKNPADQQQLGFSERAYRIFASQRITIVAAASCILIVLAAFVFVFMKLRNTDTNVEEISKLRGADTETKIQHNNLKPPGSVVQQPRRPDNVLSDAIRFEENWYWFSKQNMTLAEAQLLAKRLDGNLLVISSMEENEFVSRVAREAEKDVLLGLTRNHAGEFEAGFQNWYSGQPEDRGEPYVELSHKDGQWHDVNARRRSMACIEWGSDNEVSPPLTPPGAFRLSTSGHGGTKYLDPVVATKSWVKSGSFAHIRGPGEIVYPQLTGFSYAVELDLTLNPGRGGFSLFVGDLLDANVWMPFGIGTKDDPTRVIYRIWNWMNGGRWCWGHVESKVGERIQITLLVNESLCGVVRDGRCVHRGHGSPADPALRIVSDSQEIDATIHRCELRPLTQSDCDVAGWTMPPKDLKFDTAATKSRLDRQLEALPPVPRTGNPYRTQTTNTPMAWIQPGTFFMGRSETKGPLRHKVQLSRGFWIGMHELTQREWLLLMPKNPSRISSSPYLPVDCVTYEQTLGFCAELTRREQDLGHVPDGFEFRLPTEAEWEYACRAGSDEDLAVPKEDFWWFDTAGCHPHEVGESQPNAWGLYDMHGNAPEWCLDMWHDYPRDSGAVRVDPFTPPDQWRRRRIVRGGSWVNWGAEAFHCWDRRSHYSVPGGYRGFRVVLGPVLTQEIPEQARSSGIPR